MYEIIRKIEEKYPVNDLKVDGVCIWPLIRIKIFFFLRESANKASTSKKPKLKTLGSYFLEIFQIKNLLSRRSFLILSDSSENRIINGEYENKILFELFNQLENDYIYLERPISNAPRSNNSKRASQVLFFIVAKVISFFIRTKLENESLLHLILIEEDIQLSYENDIKMHVALYKVAIFYLKRLKPKMIFLTDHYANLNFAFTRAARELNIPVIEFQHGIINKMHPAYNYHYKKTDALLPNYLFYYLIPPIKKDSVFFLPVEDCFDVGHPYLSYISEISEAAIQKRNRKTVLITLQWTDENKVIPFIIEAAKECPTFQFILLPRDLGKDYSYDLPQNVHFERQMNFYELLRLSDIHVTTYSTCGLEAYAMGVKNILINFDNLAKAYFEEFVEECSNFVYINTLKEFSIALNHNDIITNKKSNIKLGHRELLKESLKSLHQRNRI